jgi:hypothetical protein
MAKAEKRGRRSKLVGQAGEFAFCAEAALRGYIATPFAGNVPEFDVLVADASLRSIPVQVKACLNQTRFQGGDVRIYADIDFCEKTGVQTVNGPQKMEHGQLVRVYVWFPDERSQPARFFILTTQDCANLITEHHRQYLEKHGGVRPRKPDSFLTMPTVEEFSPFENNWGLIERQLEQFHRI